MLRKTLIALAATAALGVSSVAMAAQHGGGHGGGHPGGASMAVHSGGSLGPGSGASNFRPSNVGPSGNVHPGHVVPTGRNWQGRSWAGGPWHHHHRHHDRFFFGVGYGGPYYDYGYDSCWRLVPSYWGGWRRVWACDYGYGYPYGGY